MFFMWQNQLILIRLSKFSLTYQFSHQQIVATQSQF